MTYTPTTWANGAAPALNGANLNHIEAGIAAAQLAATLDAAVAAVDANAASALRVQQDARQSFTYAALELVTGANRFNAATATLEKRINNTTGALVDEAGWWASDFVPVAASSPYWALVIWYHAFYTASRVFISGANPGNLVAGYSFTTPASAAYVRISSWHQAHIATEVIVEGASAAAWSSYQQQVTAESIREVIPASVRIDAAGRSLADVVGSLDALVTTPINLYDQAGRTDNFYCAHTTGVLTAGADHHVSDYIPITAGTSYTGNKIWKVCWYSPAETFISGSDLPPQGQYTVVSPAGAAFLRFSYWGANLDHNTIMLNLGTVAKPWVPYQQWVAATKLVHDVAFTLPATIPAVVGHELNLYFDSILSVDYRSVDIDITCAVGVQQAERWTLMPTVAGTSTLTITVYRAGIAVAWATTSVVVKAAAVGTGVTKSVVIIGDSTTDVGTPSTELVTLFGAGDPMDLTLLGTRGTAPALHEGRSGWTAALYCTVASSGGVANAFWSGSAFDFAAYKTAQGYTTVDYAVINLGINDMFAAATDAALTTAIAAALGHYDTMIASITATGAKVGVALTIPPAYTQDGFGAEYSSGQTRWRYRRNNLLWVTALISAYAGRTAESIYLVPIHAALDTEHNFPTASAAVNSRNSTTVERQNNGVHPAASGYGQIADAYHYWLKGFES